MPADQNWITQCHIKDDGDAKYYYFDTSAPKLQGFYHPLFYQTYSEKTKTTGGTFCSRCITPHLVSMMYHTSRIVKDVSNLLSRCITSRV